MSKKTEALKVILGLMPNAKFIDKNGKDVTEDVKKSHNVANNIAQRNLQDEELMKKIFPHKEIIEGESVLVFPYIEEATPLKDVPQEVVSHMEKTIDHISQEGKKVSLTEQWKKYELEEGHYYLKDNEYIFIDYFNGVSFEETCDFEIKEVLASVPSFNEWQQMKAFCEEFNALNVAEENQRLKELLKECREVIEWYKADCGYKDVPTESVLTKIDKVLK